MWPLRKSLKIFGSCGARSRVYHCHAYDLLTAWTKTGIPRLCAQDSKSLPTNGAKTLECATLCFVIVQVRFFLCWFSHLKVSPLPPAPLAVAGFLVAGLVASQ